MNEQNSNRDVDVFSKIIRAGRRTYFFDVKKTSSDDYYLTITESKKFTNEDETVYYKRHKMPIFREDFLGFKSAMEECMDFIWAEKGTEVEQPRRHDSSKENTPKATEK